MKSQKNSTKKTDAASCIPLQIQDLSANISPRDISNDAFSTNIRQLRFNERQGTVGVKTRAEVNKSRKKPWKQKGTGRARAGSARSPLWRGGGIIFGPQLRVRKLDLPQKVRQGVLNSLLFDFINREKLLVADWVFEHNTPKTKEAASFLNQANLQNQSVVLFVAAHDIHTQASFANIPYVLLVLYDAPNAYDLASGQWWVVLKKDIDLFNEMVEKWR